MSEPTLTNDAELEAVNLTSIPSKPDDADVDSLLREIDSPKKDGKSTKEEEESEPSTETQDAPDPISKVKTSSTRLLTSLALLGQDIDTKLGISIRAKQIDEKIHVTEVTRQAIGAVSNTVTDIDQRLKVTETTRNGFNAVGTKVKDVGSTQKAQEIKSKVGGVLEGAGKGLKEFDEKHGLTNKTANLVSSTADFFTSRINPNTADTSAADTIAEAATEALKTSEAPSKDGELGEFPSSFQK